MCLEDYRRRVVKTKRLGSDFTLGHVKLAFSFAHTFPIGSQAMNGQSVGIDRSSDLSKASGPLGALNLSKRNKKSIRFEFSIARVSLSDLSWV